MSMKTLAMTAALCLTPLAALATLAADAPKSNSPSAAAISTNELTKSVNSLVGHIKPELLALAAHPDVVADVKRQNLKTMSVAEIKKTQDLWLSKKVEDLAKVKGYIDNKSGDALRATMKKIPLSKCFTLDKQGNVAATVPKCHDWVHGEQPKFLDCFKSGEMVVNKPAKDLTSGLFSVQISVPIKDGKETIGVLVATFPLEMAK